MLRINLWVIGGLVLAAGPLRGQLGPSPISVRDVGAQSLGNDGGASSTDALPKGSARLDQDPSTAPVTTALAFSPNGQWLASGGDDHQVYLWDVGSQQRLIQLAGHRDWVRACRFSADSRRLYSAAMDGRVLEWDTATGKQLREIGRQDSAIFALGWSPQHDCLLSVGFRCPLQFHPLGKQRADGPWKCPCQDMRTLASSVDGRFLAAAGRNGRIRVWYLGDGTVTHEFSGHTRVVRDLAFSPDGGVLVSASDDRTWRVWDLSSGELRAVYPTGATKTLAVLALPGGTVALGGSDNLIRVLHPSNGKEQIRFRGHQGTVSALATDGVWLASASFDASIRLWRLPANTDLRHEAKRNLEDAVR